MTIEIPDSPAGLELLPVTTRERFQLCAALLGSFELLWPELSDLLGVSLADRYGEMDNAQKRDITAQLVWLMQLCLPPEEEA